MSLNKRINQINKLKKKKDFKKHQSFQKLWSILVRAFNQLSKIPSEISLNNGLTKM